jgi:hypothetical protein
MRIQPKQLSLHSTQIATDSGEWLVSVESVTETQGDGNLLLHLILEQPVDAENVRTRKLGLMVPAAVILDPETCAQIIDQIQRWVETTDGDGFLNLVQHPS